MRKKAKLRRGKGSTLIALIIMAFATFFALNVEKDSDFFNGNVFVHIVDVGQGSCAVVQKDNEAILVDSGEKQYADEVTEYLESIGVDTLKYVIASHPHTDHIGGMTEIFDSFEVETIIMPQLTEINTPTTKTYESFIDYIIDNKITTKKAVPNTSFDFGDCELEIFAPVEQIKDLNNMSVVCKITRNDSSVMILGDAEIEELETVKLSKDLDSDIIVMGHHGSSTSIYEPFLEKVNAEVAVISCGENNKYGHPHKEALDYLEENEIAYYRTDEEGTIVFEFGNTDYELVG